MAVELDSYVGVRELGKALGLSRNGVLSLCRKGVLPEGRKLGHSRRWRVADVNEALASVGTERRA